MNKNSDYSEYFDYYQNEENNKQIIGEINNALDLLEKWYLKIVSPAGTPKISRARKMSYCFKEGDVVEGHGLELGFGMGTATFALLDRFPNITLDGIDFQQTFAKIIPYFTDLYGDKIGEYWIGDMQSTEKPDNYYDFINSQSIWEHLTEEVYWNTLKECYRILKPGGKIYVYVDQGPGPEHIRVVPPFVTRQEMEYVGFKGITDYVYEK